MTDRPPHCPYGHDDATTLGYCIDEIHGNLERLMARQVEAAERGDDARVRGLARSLSIWWRRLTPSEQLEYAEDKDVET